MQEDEYRNWLAAQGKQASTASTSISTLRRIETAYGDLDREFEVSGLEAVLSDLIYSKSDERNGEPDPSRLNITRDLYNTLSSSRTHLNYYRRFLEDRATRNAVSEAVAEVTRAVKPLANDRPDNGDEAPEAVLSLEKDLNAALRQTLGQLEPGLTVIDGGRERTVASGRIDILAEDAQGRKVVIELKAVKAGRDAVGQVLAYMGDFHADDAADVRGFLIAPDFDPKAISAARMVPALELRRFSFQFSFESVGHKV